MIKFNTNMRRIISVILSLSFVISCFIVISASATEEDKSVNWKLDLEAMKDLSDTCGNTAIRLEANSTQKVMFDNTACLSVNRSRYAIHDLENRLAWQTTFHVDFDIFFDSFPVGVREGLTTDEYPMSFFTWVITQTTFPNYDRGIRIDSKGNLFFTRDTKNAIGVQLEKEKWYNFRFSISPETGGFEIYIDNDMVFRKNYSSVKETVGSYLRFLDTGLDYQAYVKNIEVTSHDVTLGVNTEPSADYIGYQVSKVQNNQFSVRFVSGLENAKAEKSGYQIIQLITDNTGKITETATDYESTSVYEKIKANGENVNAISLNTNYLTLCEIENISTELTSAIFVVRPYIVKESTRVYGKAKFLYFQGQIDNGYPVLEKEVTGISKGIVASDDTYIQNKPGQIFGTNPVLELKNSGAGSSYTRYIYLKFTIPEDMVDAAMSMETIHLRLYVKLTRQAITEEEKTKGGLLTKVFPVTGDWDESTLDYSMANTLTKNGESFDLRIGSSGYVTCNVAKYIHEVLADGERTISFRLENAIGDGDKSQTQIYSKEAGSQYAPSLSFNTAAFRRELNLVKIGNYGYEPWGYAEEIVFDWINNLKDKIYAADNNDVFELSPTDVSKPQGTHTVLTEGRSTGNPPSGTYKSLYARTIDTLISAGGYKENDAIIPEYDSYGGITNFGIKGTETGWYHTEKIGDRAYLIDPLGNPYFIIGVNAFNVGTSNQKDVLVKKYGSTEAFFESMTKNLKNIGINTANGDVTSFTGTQDPLNGIVGISGIQSYMKYLGLVVTEGVAPEYRHNNTMNVFDPDYSSYVLSTNQRTLELHAENKLVIGFTSDNELPKESNMLDNYLSLDHTAYFNAFSYAVAWTFLCEKTGKVNPSLQDVTQELREEFKCMIFAYALGAVRQSIDTYAPGRMYLGNRTDAQNKTSEGYLRAAGYYCDMLSINMYDGMEPSVKTMATIYRYSGKPFFVTEFYAKAEDAYDMNGQLLANQQNAGWQVKTQKDRASYYENYTLLLLECKYCVGWMWFTFRDNDQSLYHPTTTDTSKILRVWQKGKNLDIVSFIDQDGNIIPATGNEVRYYSGITTDMSSLGSNKGLVDNHSEMYEELSSSFARISQNLIGLVRYFDDLNQS